MVKEKRWLLGYLKGTNKPVYLFGFEWSCNWYWGGGYIGNNQFHAHFDGAFLKSPDSRGHALDSGHFVFMDPWTIPNKHINPDNIKRLSNGAAIWENLDFFLDGAQYSTKEWWRIKDLFVQFYRLRDAAEVFQYGGHCTSNRTEKEIVPDMAASINRHIKEVIIPLIEEALDKKPVKTENGKGEE